MRAHCGTSATKISRSRASSSGERAASARWPRGEYGEIAVADTGPGIPADIRGRIFEPFFCGDPAAGGMGIGLSTAHRIVSAYGGRIAVESAAGRGACFRVLLPRSAPRGDPGAEGAPPR
jgi:signal transduction histidine kinase